MKAAAWQRAIDLEQLTRWMDARELESGPLLDVEPLGGGTQNLLISFQRGDRKFVLRRPPLHLRENSSATIRKEARLLNALAGTDVPHPQLIASCDEEDVLGAAFYLMTPVEGFNPTMGLPDFHAASPAIRRAMGFELVEGLVRLGKVDHVAVGLGDFGRPDGFLERQVDRWRTQLGSYVTHVGWPGPGALGEIDELADWLERNRPQSFTPGIMHGDYHLANVMFRYDSPDLAAIVDWELATIGDPLIDLGWVLATWPEENGGTGDTPLGQPMVDPWDGFPSSRELVDYYVQRSHRDCSAIHWYSVFACYKFGIILEGTYARACAGKTGKDVGDTLHQSAVSLLARARRLAER